MTILIIICVLSFFSFLWFFYKTLSTVRNSALVQEDYSDVVDLLIQIRNQENKIDNLWKLLLQMEGKLRDHQFPPEMVNWADGLAKFINDFTSKSSSKELSSGEKTEVRTKVVNFWNTLYLSLPKREVGVDDIGLNLVFSHAAIGVLMFTFVVILAIS